MTILVGYIPSPQGDAALDVGVQEARVHDSTLLVLNVARGESLQERRRLYDEQAQELVTRLDATGVRYRLQRETAPEHAAATLIAIAEQTGARMVVIGLRRRSATGKLLFGSTAQELLMGSPCPVLTVRAE